MARTEKNNPGPVVIGAIAVIVFLILFYFVLVMFFPGFFESLYLGDAQPVK